MDFGGFFWSGNDHPVLEAPVVDGGDGLGPGGGGGMLEGLVLDPLRMGL